ncbi:helicase-related protein [Meiothermus taiwanensis]|uniref:Helicase n=1 Tax=Meiothermus taiwanensis WR-220 TaxID=1339250 RepID=A0ABM6WJ33_9DEIN|nr:helicase-related protein [Meiothermus taiwanensis]AWR87062.1 helicase [Meiothermus taiwanensis WR-220]
MNKSLTYPDGGLNYTPGSLIKARGREWVVLPESQPPLLIARPIGGTEEEISGIHTELEEVSPSSFGAPTLDDQGDYRSGRLLREAVRLTSRNVAGPFRSFGRIAVEPRPYQLVPLLMALQQDPVRLLIADDVGIGKSVEALLIARELLDRGEIRSMAVLCPPHLAEQWQSELSEKFHLEAERVLSSTAARLERGLRVGETLFQRYPLTVVSLDFIKSERRREEFLRTAPELIIVDEAHTCAYGGVNRGGQHQRHTLVARLAEDPGRHLILVTATPHSGHEEAFRSLLALLDPAFREMPPDLSRQEAEGWRRRLARYLVQRKRADIRHYMQEDTPFPERLEAEVSYSLSPEYGRLLDRVLAYARELVSDPTGDQRHRRVRWWAALALLRSVASSPRAAAAALRNRAAMADAETAAEVDELGQRMVLDQDEYDQEFDLTPGAEVGPEEAERRRLRELAREAEALAGAKDRKLQGAIELVKGLLAEGHQPIVFCRFIQTAEYVAEHLRQALGAGVAVEAVTGLLSPPERELAVERLGAQPVRVLVATDCLSEGINLQQYFSAVLHYDLSWNPTRHEQREGRVDRYGQPRRQVKTLTYFGANNPVDGIVLEVLLRKHRAIRSTLGVSVPVPVDNDAVIQAVMQSMLLRDTRRAQMQSLFEAFDEQALEVEWRNAAEREKRSRTLFAQHSLKPEEVARQLAETRRAVGSGVEVERFLREALEVHGGQVQASGEGLFYFDLSGLPRALRDLLGRDRLKGRFSLPVQPGEEYISRTHPLVETLASFLLEGALDPLSPSRARRAGVIATAQVRELSTLLLLRLRYQLTTTSTRKDRARWQQLAEEVHTVAFRGFPEAPQWLDEAEVEALWQARPTANLSLPQAQEFAAMVLPELAQLQGYLEGVALERAVRFEEDHRAVRQAADLKLRYEVEPILPVDLVGVYIYVPR